MATPAVHSVIAKHRTFVILVSVAFALLYAELAWFVHVSQRARSDGEAWAMIAAVFVIALMGHFVSFLPARPFVAPGAEQQASLVLPALTAQLGQGAGIVLLASALCCALTFAVAGGDLVAAYSILNNIYVLVAAGAVFLHVLVTYVRYGALLYAVKQDSWQKVLVTSGGIGLVILGAFLFLINLEIAWLNGAPAALRGLYGLHVYGRDLFFFSVVMGIYGWHIRWMADH